MKILHISDVHYSPKHLGWVNVAMYAAIDAGIDAGCDLAIISGDLFDHGVGAHEPAYLAAATALANLSEAMPVYVLQGTHSHDRPGMLGPLAPVGRRHPCLGAYTPAMSQAR